MAASSCPDVCEIIRTNGTAVDFSLSKRRFFFQSQPLFIVLEKKFISLKRFVSFVFSFSVSLQTYSVCANIFLWLNLFRLLLTPAYDLWKMNPVFRSTFRISRNWQPSIWIYLEYNISWNWSSISMKIFQNYSVIMYSALYMLVVRRMNKSPNRRFWHEMMLRLACWVNAGDFFFIHKLKLAIRNAAERTDERTNGWFNNMAMNIEWFMGIDPGSWFSGSIFALCERITTSGRDIHIEFWFWIIAAFCGYRENKE